ncbi:cyclase family protein [Streptomyces sp. NPDC004629]|uniref:cyclase family protein n=1 Tax=Streptomyces sp. NPDC004629 TaxID=3364705 RepID=UPI0036A63FEE
MSNVRENPAADDHWGRWGPDDEIGAANEIGSQATRRGLDAATSGTVIPLATPIRNGRGFGLVGRTPPAHFMLRSGSDYAAGLPERGGFGFADDVVTMPTHGSTHVDALSHVWCEGRMYNGYTADSVTSRGARHLGIDKMPPIVTRGVVVDTAPGGVRSVDDPVGPEELADLLARADVELAPGDALLVRTGWLSAALRGEADGTSWPGLDRTCGSWLAERRIALVGADNPGVEVFPSTDPGCQVPLHLALIRGCGVYFAELMALDPLCKAGQACFLFVLSPLPIVGGVGSPVSPVAVL